jgi:hypothetical protein
VFANESSRFAADFLYEMACPARIIAAARFEGL